MATRAAMWERLGQTFDVLVIGGGITGTGIARDAAMRGLRVALVEKYDLAFGTSSRSSKLVHGGLRYLEQREFSLVFEAVSERRVLMDIAPHLVKPLAFLFPVYEASRQPLWMINTGLWLYDGLSLFRSPKVHTQLSLEEVAREEPALNREGLVGVPLYYDCATNDARLVVENALDAKRMGAVVVTGAPVVRTLRGDDGLVYGAVVRDEGTGVEREVRASCVVNATGPWTDQILGMERDQKPRPLLRPTKGVHLVVDSTRLPIKHAVVCFHPADGRVLFAIPWGDRAYIGTTDTDWDGDPASVHASSDDVRYLLDAVNGYFPAVDLRPRDVISTWAGLRPLIRPPESEGMGESSVSREHEIHVSADGIVTIAGGKLTTYRRMAAETVDRVEAVLRMSERLPARLRSARTDREPMPGAMGWPEDGDATRVIEQVRAASSDAISEASAAILVDTYGMRALDIAVRVASDPSLAEPIVPGRPEIVAQIDVAVDEELARDVGDVLVRRTQIYYRDPDQGCAAADLVAARIGARLGWDQATVDAAAARYRAEVADTRAWQADGGLAYQEPPTT